MTPTIPDEAVQAALAHYSEGGCMGLDEYERREVTVDMLSAALPFLQGVKVKALEWRNVDAVCAWCYAKSPVGEYRVTWSFSESGHKLHYPDGTTKQFDGVGYGDIEAAKAAAQADFTRRASSMLEATDTRAAALEEAILKHLKWFERFICDQDELNSSTPRKVAQNAKDAAEELRSTIRALSGSGDGWLPIETAPKDGTEFIGWDGKWAFRCSAGKKYVLYPHMDGGPTYCDVWDGHYYDSLTIEHPTHWRPLPSAPADGGE